MVLLFSFQFLLVSKPCWKLSLPWPYWHFEPVLCIIECLAASLPHQMPVAPSTHSPPSTLLPFWITSRQGRLVKSPGGQTVPQQEGGQKKKQLEPGRLKKDTESNRQEESSRNNNLASVMEAEMFKNRDCSYRGDDVLG